MSVYRVAGLPTTVSADGARSILDDYFGSDAQMKIRSLGIHPQRPSIVAIVMFSNVPACLTGASPWRPPEKIIKYDGQSQHIRLEIDTAFLGFTPLNLVRDGEDDQIDCIVVSGLSSHPFGSWKERGGQFMWIVDDPDAHQANVRMLLYGYDTSLVASKSFQDIEDIGERLAISIKSIRRPIPGTNRTELRPIVFIAHSLGGLVVKEAVCYMAERDQIIAQCVYGFLFFGVPHHGLLIKPWLPMVNNQANEELVKSLAPGSRVLQRLDEKFRKLFTFPGSRAVSIYETLQSNTTKEKAPGIWDRSGELQVLVDRASAVGHWPGSVLNLELHVNRTHEDLPKFKGIYDHDYLIFVDHLKDIWSNAVSTVRGRVAAEIQDTASVDEPSAPEEDLEVAIETPLIGLHQLWPYPGTEDVKIEVDLIAIHGLAGHALKTWTEADRLWLRDFLPRQLRRVGVSTFGYDARQVFNGAALNARALATQLLESIQDIRRKQKVPSERKIIFLCHGFGGIVFKQAFMIANENENLYGPIGRCIVGVIFLGTPHIVNNTQFWSDYVKRVATAHKLKPPRLSSRESKSNDAELRNLCSQFAGNAMHLQIFSLYEQLVTKPLDSLVIEESCVVLRLPNETRRPLDADHRGMCKFVTDSDPSYLAIYKCVDELVDTLSRQDGEYNRSAEEFLSRLGTIDANKSLNFIPHPWGNSSKWLIESTEFQTWTTLQGHQVLWLCGPPGSGKTVLMRNAVQYLEQQSQDISGPIIRKPLLFFFDDKDVKRKTSFAFVASILNQIFSDPRTGYVFKYLDGRNHKEDASSEDSLWDCLVIIIEMSRGIMFQLVVDAVDEVLRNTPADSTSILDRLEQLTSLDTTGRVKIILSNRERRSYEFENSDIAEIDVNNTSTQQSVHRYIRARIHNALKRSYISQDVASDIEIKLIEISGGNFLHAKLAWEQFSRGVERWTRGQIQDSLSRLNKASHDLVAVYCRLLRSIPSAQLEKASASFAILRVSQEKFTSLQLAFLATVYTNKLAHRPMILRELLEQSADFESYLIEACGYIITKSKDSAVDFAHVSVKDLFATQLDDLEPGQRQILARYAVSEAEAHAILYTSCVSTMELEDQGPKPWMMPLVEWYLEQNVQPDRIRMMSLIGSESKTPYFCYALQYWATHYGGANARPSDNEILASFLFTKTAYYCHMLWWIIEPGYHPELFAYRDAHINKDFSPTCALFRTLARGDFPKLIKALIFSYGANVNFCGNNYYMTPLSWAIVCERKESFKVLLRCEDISVNYGDASRRKPMHYAAACRDPFYIQKLTEHPYTNVNVMYTNANIELGIDGSPLHEAMRTTNIEAVQVLLDHPYIDLDTRNSLGQTPIDLAYLNEVWEPTLERMLKIASERVLSPTISTQNPFLQAGALGWSRIEKAILEYYPSQVQMIDRDSQMIAIATYAYYGRKEKLLWILDRLPPEAGIGRLRHMDQSYDLLHLCAHQNWEDVVRRLQEEYHLKSLPSDHVGRTLLHWSIEYNWDTSKLNLGDYSSDELNHQDRDGQTAVHLAVETRNMPALELLMASGASYMLKDKKGFSAVHLAAEQGYQAALEFFLEMPEREFGRTKTGATLLHLLALWMDGTILRRFVRFKRAKLDLVDKKRRSALHYAAMSNNVSAAEQLVALGCDMEITDSSGMTPLLEAIRNGSTETAEHLLKVGANAWAVDAFGQSCLHLSFRYGHDGFVSRFLRMGLNISTADRFGMTPLHRACSTGIVQHIEKLRLHGAKWNPKNIYGRSPIDLAVERRNIDAVEVMISWLRVEKASERRTKRRLHNALKIACELEFKDLDRILVKAGAEVDRRQIKVKHLYLPGDSPEPGRWMLQHWTRPKEFVYRDMRPDRSRRPF